MNAHISHIFFQLSRVAQKSRFLVSNLEQRTGNFENAHILNQ